MAVVMPGERAARVHAQRREANHGADARPSQLGPSAIESALTASSHPQG
ncbi:hypothetical protein DB30_03897 [Enhygromyxa salina]|uniref:Uncharacterized protein n=1 Tax=Enhygromyxa salina TaxID=215803 RepID=A0A0C2D893_9BACT|nr:hypothetical protein DB30_03897 [Enhygromyxa salina]